MLGCLHVATTVKVSSCNAGAGKTYTMLGKDDHPGIMARALTELFTQMRRTRDDHVYKVSMSYLEVHLTLSIIHGSKVRIKPSTCVKRNKINAAIATKKCCK